MITEFENKIIEDILIVISNLEHIPNTYICSDKYQKIFKNKSKKAIPLIIVDDNIYIKLRNKVFHYFKNIDKYKGIGIENIDQYLSLILLKKGKLYGRDKKEALIIKRYTQDRKILVKQGFYNATEYLEYERLLDSKDLIYYVAKKEYNKNKKELEAYGIFSLQDYLQYNNMINKSFIAYTHDDQINNNIIDFLSFELREFYWKKQYKEKNGTLKGVQKYIKYKYANDTTTLNMPNVSYYQEPNYYYITEGLRNYGEYYEKSIFLQELRHKYKCEKIKIPFEEYVKKAIMQKEC